MKRTLLAIWMAAILAGPAGAASITVDLPGGDVYSPGESIEILLVAEVGVGEDPADSVLVELESDDPSAVSFDEASQFLLTSGDGGSSWFPQELSCEGASCTAVAQANPLPSLSPDPFSGVISAISATAGSPGTATIGFPTFEFFNDPIGPVSGRPDPFTITVVPEPSTAAMVACGLLGLAAARRLRLSTAAASESSRSA